MDYVPEDGESLAREIAEGGLVSASISAVGAPDGEGRATRSRIRIRPVELKRGLAFQFERLDGAKARHENVEPERLAGALAEIFSRGVAGAEFALRDGTLRLVSNRRGAVRALRSRAPRGRAAASDPAPERHDRERSYILSEGTPIPFLVDLGVMTGEGAVVGRMRDKFRQINRFLEFIADVVPELEAALCERAALAERAARADGAPNELTVVDFGCGKSYLTFATYHYLSRIRALPVRVVGLDLKADVIAECSRLARDYGYEGLSFAVGDISEYAGCDSADLVISLHACDVATDYALERAVRWNARVILSVPCCQHELNARLGEKAESRAGGGPGYGAGREILAPALGHGIVRERLAALFTDAMRASLLEGAGYRTQILEFIDMSHTPKNLLIRAVRQTDRAVRQTDRAVKPRVGSEASPPADYARLRDFLGAEPTLERLLRDGTA